MRGLFEEKCKKLVNSLKLQGIIKSKEVENAFLKVPRHLFVPEDLVEDAYVDAPLPIGAGQTISAPHMVAIMLELLELKKGQKVLEIGAGSGWNACLIAEIIGEDGKVYTIERIPEIADFAKRNVEKAGYDNVEVIVGDGTLGYEPAKPYDRIMVTAAAPIIPDPLLKQLRRNGILLAPVGNRFCQELLKVVKEEEVKITKHGYCVFVPLVGKYGFSSS